MVTLDIEMGVAFGQVVDHLIHIAPCINTGGLHKHGAFQTAGRVGDIELHRLGHSLYIRVRDI